MTTNQGSNALASTSLRGHDEHEESGEGQGSCCGNCTDLSIRAHLHLPTFFGGGELAWPAWRQVSGRPCELRTRRSGTLRGWSHAKAPPSSPQGSARSTLEIPGAEDSRCSRDPSRTTLARCPVGPARRGNQSGFPRNGPECLSPGTPPARLSAAGPTPGRSTESGAPRPSASSLPRRCDGPSSRSSCAPSRPARPPRR